MEEIANPSQLITPQPQSQQSAAPAQSAAPTLPPPVNNPETEPSHSSKRWLIVVGILTLVLLIAAGGYYFFVVKSNQQKADTKQVNTKERPAIPFPTRVTTSIDNWQKPQSNQKGFPIGYLRDRPLTIYNITEDKIVTASLSASNIGFASGIGSSSPEHTPNFLYTAFIDTKTYDLFLLSHETMKPKQISPKDMIVEYISGWSPDSKKLVYVSGQNSFPAIGGSSNEKRVAAKPDQDGGEFYLFDIDTGISTKLPIEDYALYGFIDSTHLLLKNKDPNTGSDGDKLIIFNTNTFELDTSIQESFGFGANQFDFSRDGKKWTYTISRNPTTDANIILADFPSREGLQIDNGQWADVQMPKLSPNATKVAYQKREGYIRDGVPKEAVWIYNTTTKEKARFADGWPYLWIDDNTLVTYIPREQDQTGLYILDLQTRTTKKIY